MLLKPSELILNPDGSVYHLNLKPHQIAKNILLVGDPDRVTKITKHFSHIEFTTQKREFKTTTGIYNNKQFTVISTGIGADNIDIVLNELDALVNVNLSTRRVKEQLTCLNIVRIGTSGALQPNINVNSFLVSSQGLDLVGMLHAYQIEKFSNAEMVNAFVKHTSWSHLKAMPLILESSKTLEHKLISNKTHLGITATAGGFYGPQGRVIRLALKDIELNKKIESFCFNNSCITNLEMETASIYGLAKLLGHNACSINAILANRITNTFSKNPEKVIEDLIEYTLNKLTY